MAKEFANQLEYLPFRVKVFHNEPLDFEQERLWRILDGKEAKAVQLNTAAYRDVVRKMLENTDGDSRITVVVLDKASGDPVGLSTFLERGYPDLDRTVPASGHSDMKEQLGKSSRKVMYELQYILRSPNVKGRAMGDLLLACGLEALGSVVRKKSVDINAWLYLAGSFANHSALELYTKYRFRVVGFAPDGRIPVLSLSDVPEHVERAKLQMQRQLEFCFLMPLMKEERVARSQEREYLSPPEEREPDFEEGTDEVSQLEDDEHVAGSTDHGRESMNQSFSDADEMSTHSQETLCLGDQSMESQEEAQPPCEGGSHLEQELSALRFRKYVDQLKWSSSLVFSLSGEDEGARDMLENVSVMAKRVSNAENSFSFLQHLQMTKQIEAYALAKGENPLNLLEEISAELTASGNARYSVSYLRKMVRLSWCVHRYCFFEQAMLSWSTGLERIPRLARQLDDMVDNGKAFPDNVVAAQRDRFSVFVKISLLYPEIRAGDGDGLSHCKLLGVHAAHINDEPVDENDLPNPFQFQEVRNREGELVRLRFVAFDTQESPIGEQELPRKVPVSQYFWEMGRNFLESQMELWLEDVPKRDAVLVCDCYGLDVYGRLLVDLRGIRRRGEEILRSSLNRFEMAETFLKNGVAHPTYESYASEELIRAFASARERRMGAFADPEGREFVHPSVYRRARRKLITALKKRKRPAYRE